MIKGRYQFAKGKKKIPIHVAAQCCTNHNILFPFFHMNLRNLISHCWNSVAFVMCDAQTDQTKEKKKLNLNRPVFSLELFAIYFQNLHHEKILRFAWPKCKNQSTLIRVHVNCQKWWNMNIFEEHRKTRCKPKILESLV